MCINFLLNIAGNIHYTCFPSLIFFASLHLVMTLRWIQASLKYWTYYLNYFSQVITLNLRVRWLDRNQYRHHFILILLQSHQNKKNFSAANLTKFWDQFGTFAFLGWETWHHQIVTFYHSLVQFFFVWEKTIAE